MNKRDILNKILKINEALKEREKQAEDNLDELQTLRQELPDVRSCLRYLAEYTENADEENLKTVAELMEGFYLDIETANAFTLSLSILFLYKTVAQLKGISDWEVIF